ncbi:MAG TPA: PAS domain-containing sensor histidine kinase [Phycisphaerales bacterium]|nr:PAS domain-containing sensor histidine kinase [Phycisphaerales bacterium]
MKNSVTKKLCLGIVFLVVLVVGYMTWGRAGVKMLMRTFGNVREKALIIQVATDEMNAYKMGGRLALEKYLRETNVEKLDTIHEEFLANMAMHDEREHQIHDAIENVSVNRLEILQIWQDAMDTIMPEFNRQAELAMQTHREHLNVKHQRIATMDLHEEQGEKLKRLLEKIRKASDRDIEILAVLSQLDSSHFEMMHADEQFVSKIEGQKKEHLKFKGIFISNRQEFDKWQAKLKQITVSDPDDDLLYRVSETFDAFVFSAVGDDQLFQLHEREIALRQKALGYLARAHELGEADGRMSAEIIELSQESRRLTLTDVVLEIIVSTILFVLVCYLWQRRKAHKEIARNGWYLILWGFVLLLVGSLFDITDNFEYLNRYVVVGNTGVEAFFEKIVGFLGGFLLLAIGLARWIPTITNIEQIQQLNKKLEKEVIERKKTAKELDESERKREASLENSPVCTKIVGLDFNLKYMSRAGIEVLKIDDVEEFYGKPYPLPFSPEPFKTSMLKCLERVKKTGEIVTHENSLVDMDGNELWFHSTIVPVNDEQGQISDFIVVSSDITESKRAEVYLKSAAEAAEAANITKSQFLANMSHEIRTPMNSIISLSKTLGKQNTGNLTQRQKDGLRMIHQSGERLLLLINDILDLSKVESGKIEPHPEAFYLDEVIEPVETLAKNLIGDSPIDFVLEKDDAVAPVIVSDSLMLHQILVNIVGNAIKFTEEGRIVLKIYAKDEKLFFEVTDSGIGISEDNLETIFAEFTQVDSSLTRKYRGSGLGLAICKKMLEMLNGGIVAESQPGQWTKVTFYIPLVIAEIADVEAVPVSSYLAEGAMAVSKAKVLIAEDDEFGRAAVEMMLEGHYNLVFAADGKEVVEKYFAESPDIVLMDIMMPVMDGFQAFDEICKRNKGRKIPIIALTAKAMKKDRGELLRYGFTDFISKPIDDELLIKTIDKYLGKAGSGKA